MHAQATPRGSRLKSPAIYEDVESQQYRLLGQQPNSRARGQHGLCERVTAPSQTWVPAPHPFLALGRRKRQCKTGQTSHGTRRNLHRLHTHTHTHSRCNTFGENGVVRDDQHTCRCAGGRGRKRRAQPGSRHDVPAPATRRTALFVCIHVPERSHRRGRHINEGLAPSSWKRRAQGACWIGRQVHRGSRQPHAFPSSHERGPNRAAQRAV